MNTHDKSIAELRRLLEIWLEGESSSGDDNRISALLDAIHSAKAKIPDDLAVTARLFADFQTLAARGPNDTPEMPAIYSERIEDALKREIAVGEKRSPHFGKPYASGHFYQLFAGRLRALRATGKRAYRIAGIILIVIASPLLAYHFMNGLKDKNPKVAVHRMARNHSATGTFQPETAASSSEVGDTLQLCLGTASESPQRPASVAPHTKPANKAGHVSSTSSSVIMKDDSAQVSEEPEEWIESVPVAEMVMCQLTEEERRMADANYKIVSDPREADAIVASVLCRMSGNLLNGNSRLEEIDMKYAAVSNKLSPISDVKLSKDNYDERKIEI